MSREKEKGAEEFRQILLDKIAFEIRCWPPFTEGRIAMHKIRSVVAEAPYPPKPEKGKKS